MPEEWFFLPEDMDINYPIICTGLLLKFLYHLDKEEIEKAKETGEQILGHKANKIEEFKNIIRLELLYLEILGACRQEEINRLYTDSLIKFMEKNKKEDFVIKVKYAYELLINEDKESAKYQLVLFKNLSKTSSDVQSIEDLQGEIERVNNCARKRLEIDLDEVTSFLTNK